MSKVRWSGTSRLAELTRDHILACCDQLGDTHRACVQPLWCEAEDMGHLALHADGLVGGLGADHDAHSNHAQLLWCLSQARLGRHDPTARADDTCRYRSAGHGSGTSGSCVILKISLKGFLFVSNVSPGSNSMTCCFLLERRPGEKAIFEPRTPIPDPQ
jgi:hypothetical protein